MELERHIVFISDKVKDYMDSTLESKNLEMPSEHYFETLYNTIKEIDQTFTYYDSPKHFLNNIHMHKNDVVISTWSGKESRNRKALIPSICEAYNIPYVGADSYFQLIAADKFLCKRICDLFQIKSAKSVLIKNEDDFWLLDSLNFPIIVKPNFEGGSIGIFQNNVVDNKSEARQLCINLLQKFNPLIAEEYIDGYEVSICVAGITPKIDIFQVIQQKINNTAYFKHEIFGAEIKKINSYSRKLNIANNLVSKDVKDNIIRLYNSFGKIEVIRFDGRINSRGFYMLELTPDCSLNVSGSVSLAFKESGFNYKEMIKYLLFNSIKSWEDQNANM